MAPGGEEGHGVRDRPWPWHWAEAWGRRDLDGPQSAGGGRVKIMMLDYSNNDEDGDDDVVFRDVEG